jgi:hypothetical protein
MLGLEKRVRELEEKLECAMNLKKRLAKLQEQFDAAVKLCYHWEKECIVARKERDKATQGVKNEVHTPSCETVEVVFKRTHCGYAVKVIGGGGGGGE